MGWRPTGPTRATSSSWGSGCCASCSVVHGARTSRGRKPRAVRASAPRSRRATASPAPSGSARTSRLRWPRAPSRRSRIWRSTSRRSVSASSAGTSRRRVRRPKTGNEARTDPREPDRSRPDDCAVGDDDAAVRRPGGAGTSAARSPGHAGPRRCAPRSGVKARRAGVPRSGLPAPAYVLGERRVLPDRKDLLEGEVMAHRKGAHHDLIELIVRFDLHYADDPALPGNLVQALDDAGLDRGERRLRLLLPFVPELVAVEPGVFDAEADVEQHRGAPEDRAAPRPTPLLSGWPTACPRRARETRRRRPRRRGGSRRSTTPPRSLVVR